MPDNDPDRREIVIVFVDGKVLALMMILDALSNLPLEPNNYRDVNRREAVGTALTPLSTLPPLAMAAMMATVASPRLNPSVYDVDSDWTKPSPIKFARGEYTYPQPRRRWLTE